MQSRIYLVQQIHNDFLWPYCKVRDVRLALNKVKKRKSVGNYDIPVDTLFSGNCVELLKLLNCSIMFYNTSIVLEA